MTEPALRLESATVRFGARTLWSDVNLSLDRGEFLAVLGPNGAGKSTFLKVLLGLQRLNSGTAQVLGKPVRRGSHQVGYIPQHHQLELETPLRAKDLVAMGLEGHKYGIPWVSRRSRARIDELIDQVGAAEYAQRPVGLLSGGEQQRLRAAQALAGNPGLLLCDEPLHSLDLNHQRAITELIRSQAVDRGAAVVFVTHEINPVIKHVDRVLYFARGDHRMGTVQDVMRSEVLSELYQSPVEVIEHKGRLVVMGEHSEGVHHD